MKKFSNLGKRLSRSQQAHIKGGGDLGGPFIGSGRCYTDCQSRADNLNQQNNTFRYTCNPCQDPTQQGMELIYR